MMDLDENDITDILIALDAHMGRIANNLSEDRTTSKKWLRFKAIRDKLRMEPIIKLGGEPYGN